jgi:hypothetical protein
MAGWLRRIGAGAAALALAACAADPMAPDLDALYARAAVMKGERNPVVTIPGILGARLVDPDSGVMVWGGDDRLSADPDNPEEARAIALPFARPGEALRDLRDGVRTDGVVRVARPSFLGLTVSLDVYSGLVRTLISGGYDFRLTREAEIAERAVNLDAFEFPYDWRRDLVEAAVDLGAFLERKAAQVRAERLRVLGTEGEPVKFDLVAHSTGALVARYFLMYGATDLPADGSLPPLTWAGARLVDRAVLVAPPFMGAVTAFDNLVSGRTFGPLQPFYPPAVLGTFPALYQLMPRDRHGRVRRPDGAPLIGLHDPAVWIEEGWGLADPAQAAALAVLMPDEPDPGLRRERALATLSLALERARRFHAAIDRRNIPPDDLDLYLVVGGGFATPAGATWDRASRSLRVDRAEEGDGVVLRASALADERAGVADVRLAARTPHHYRSTLLLPDEHVELTLSPVFGDNLLFWLLEGERADERLRAPVRLDAAMAEAAARLRGEGGAGSAAPP